MNSKGADGHRPWLGARIIAPALLISIVALAACGRSTPATPGSSASTPHAAAAAVVPMTCPKDAMATTRPDGTTRLAYSGHAVTCVVGSAGVYRVTAYGADGGGGFANVIAGKIIPADTHPGKGAMVRGEFALAAGQQITILVGGVGFTAQGKPDDTIGGAGGGGGGTFVVSGTQALAVAGGGGGAGVMRDGTPGSDQPAGNNTNARQANYDGGGQGGTAAPNGSGGGGGGLNANGGNAQPTRVFGRPLNGTPATGGAGFAQGGAGGKAGSAHGNYEGDRWGDGANGGFGGGGGGGLQGGGGGGGFSGGDAGDAPLNDDGGNGGGSFVAADAHNAAKVAGGNTLNAAGNGEVTIAYVSPIPTSAGGGSAAAPPAAGTFWILQANGRQTPDGMQAVLAHVGTDGKLLGTYPVQSSVGVNNLTLVADGSGNMWVPIAGGAEEFNGTTGSGRSLSLPDALSRGLVESIAVDGAGNPWLAVSTADPMALMVAGLNGQAAPAQPDDQLVAFDRASLRPLRTLGVGIASISKIAFDRSGDLWVAGDAGIEKLSPAAQRLWMHKDGYGYGDFTFDRQGNAWAIYDDSTPNGDVYGMTELSPDGKVLRQMKLPSGGSIGTLPNGNIWIAANGIRIYSPLGQLLHSFEGTGHPKTWTLDSMGHLWTVQPPVTHAAAPTVGATTAPAGTVTPASLVEQDLSGAIVRTLALPYAPKPDGRGGWIGLGRAIVFVPR